MGIVKLGTPENNLFRQHDNTIEFIDSFQFCSSLILPHDPSIGGILLGNNNKIDESMVLFDESIFLFLD